MDELKTIVGGLDWSVPINLLLSVVPALICIVLHELAHGYAAYALGDRTAKDSGRLSLNPLRHIDPLGLLMMIVCHFGWAKPVPVDMRNFRSPRKGMAITALAGPLCNFVIAAVALFIYGAAFMPLYLSGSAAGGYILEMIFTTASLSIVLGVFNLIPIPPLDGSKVLFSLLGDEKYYRILRYERFGMLVLIALSLLNVFDNPLYRAASAVLGAMSVFVEWGSRLYTALSAVF